MKRLRINFFEEFYTLNSLKNRCKEIQFPSTIYLACESFELFLNLRQEINSVAPHITLGFWPIFKKSYWISPFSFTEELNELLNSFNSYSGKEIINVLMDFELPLRHPKLLITNAVNFRKNKLVIEDILRLSFKQKFQFLAAEYPMPFSFIKTIGKLLGIHYSHSKFKYTTITMQYNTNIGKITKRFFMNKIIDEVGKNSNYEIALGLIAPGVFNEKNLLSPKVLHQDLLKLSEDGITSVTIYSFEGYQNEYKKVIDQFAHFPNANV